MSKNDRKYYRDKIGGAFYGFAIGDAMGATTEFMTKAEIKRVHGTVKNIVGGGWLRLDPGQVTDDTEMMLCVAEGYKASVENGSRFVKEVSDRFIDWYKSGPVDCGGACAIGIKRLIDGTGPVVDEHVLGNGALMRALPMALLDKIGMNMMQCDMTHCNSVQHYFVMQYHEMVVGQVYGGGRAIEWSTNRYFPHLADPDGHVANTMYHAIKHINASETFKDVIVGAVNGGGDADTIAAIAGGLAGAKYGLSNIPKRWIKQLDSGVCSRLESMVEFYTDQVCSTAK